MKRLSIFARAASHPRRCHGRPNPSFVQRSRAISTTLRRSLNDDTSESPRKKLSIEDIETNPKHNDPYIKDKHLPSGWQEAFALKEGETAGDNELSEENLEDNYINNIALDAAASVPVEENGFNGPNGTNEYGLTEREMIELEKVEELQEDRYDEHIFSMDVDKYEDPGEAPTFDADDITSDGHRELEQHREMREFARVIAWDMPLLWNHRKEYEPPTAKTPLRFRYTTYLGETHPASRKVVLDFSPANFSDLEPVQLSKLIKLLGARYNPSEDTAKMSCEMFPTAAQNKRYLGDLLDKLLTEARDGKDTFEDVPFDFRHHKVKRTPKFPEEWKMTRQRRMELDRKREAQAELGGRRVQRDRLLSGKAMVETLEDMQAQEEPVMVPAGTTRSPEKGPLL